MALKTFTAKNNATRAAKKALTLLGCADPAAGDDFTIAEVAGGKFTYTVAPKWMPQTEEDEPTPVACDNTPEELAAVNALLNGETATSEEADVTVELLIDKGTITKVGASAEEAPPAPIEDVDLEALAPAPNPPKEKPAKPLSARAQAKADAVADAKAGNLPEHLTIGSAANLSYQKRADALRELAEAGDLEGLNAPINGVNTYANKLRAYRDLLVLAVTAKAAS